MVKVKGIVEKGSGRGKTDFVPTINLMLENVPSDLDFGIYTCSLSFEGGDYSGALHYGPRSTIDNLVTFEVNIFDFDKDVYGHEVEVDVLDKIREIVKFENEEQLQSQILQDIEDAKRMLNIN